MSEISFIINGERKTVDIEENTPLLWVIRDELGLTGTKYSCGEGFCGSCTVLLGDEAIRSCVTPVSEIRNKSITTIEGLAADQDNPIIKAWIENEVPQCGYCQPGQIMQAAALFKEKPNPSQKEIEDAMNGVLCRCGTYPRIKKAIKDIIQSGVK